jgi:hypothetical protein
MRSSLFVFVALAACSGRPKPAGGGGSGSMTTKAPIDDGDDAILAAVYLHEIAAGGIKPDEGLCLRVRDDKGKTADASPALVELIKKTHPRAIPASACSGGGKDPVVVTSPPGKGVMFDIGPVVRKPPGAVVEGGGAHRGGGAIREVEYVLESGPTGWKVKSERVLRET